MSNIEVTLSLNDGNFVAQLTRNNQVLREFGGTAGTASGQVTQISRALTEYTTSQRIATEQAKGFVATMRDVSIITGTLSLAIAGASRIFDSWVGGIVRVNAEFERLETLMRGMSTALDPIADAKGRMDQLIKTADKAPFAMKTLADSMAKLQSTGTDPLNGSLQSLIDGVAAFGGTDEQFKRATLAITQMSGKGVIQMEELRQQLGEAMPEAVAIMARSLGVTVPQLIKDISTGTVSAQKALQAFQGELDRTYGGKGVEMMETFNGKLQQMQTRFQLLAKNTGEAGFMKELEKQLDDFITFLSSDEAEIFAKEIGQTFASLASGLREVLDFAIRFRDEIKTMGTVLLTVWASNRVLSGINSMVQGIGAARGALAGLRRETQLVREIQALEAAGNSTGAALLRAQGSARTFSSAIAGMATGLAALTPAFAIAGMAIFGIIEYFDLFNQKGKNAYDTIVNIGQAAREQMDLAKEFGQDEINDLQNKRLVLAQRLEQSDTPQNRERYVGRELRQQGYRLRPAEEQEQLRREAEARWDAMLAAKRQEIETIDRDVGKIRGNLSRAETDLVSSENDRVLDKFRADLEKKLDANNAANLTLRRETEKSFTDQIAALDASGKSSEVMRRRYSDTMRQQSIDYYNRELEALKDQERLKREEIKKGLEGQAKDQADAQLLLILDRAAKSRADRAAVEQQDVGSPMNAKGIDDNKLYSKGQTKLNGLKDDIAGLRAELQGAEGDVAELQSALDRNVYGNPEDVARVKELITALKEAAAEKAALDDLMKGKREFDNDVTNARLRLLQREAEAQKILTGQTETETNKIKRKWEEGGYAGLGPNSPIQQGLRQVTGLINNQGEASNRAGEALRGNTFGQQTVQHIRTVNDALNETVSILQRIANGSALIDLGQLQGGVANGGAGFDGAIAPMMENLPAKMADRMKMAMDIFMREGGLSRAAAAGIAGNIYGESKFNTSAVGDNGRSKGIVQWKDERWTGMQNFAATQGVSPYDFTAQLRYVLKELRDNPGYGLEQLKIAGTPEQAAEIFMRKFERPAEWAIQQSGPGRKSAARTAFGTIGDESFAPTRGAAEVQGPQAPVVSTYKPVYVPSAEDNTLLAEQNRLLAERDEKLAGVDNLETKVVGTEQAAARKEKNDEILRLIQEAKEEETGLNKNLAALQKVIRSGKFGDTAALKDPGNDVYKAMIANAKELDRVEQEMATKKKSRTQIENAQEQFASKRKELDARAQEALARMDDPLEQKTSRAYRTMRAELEAYTQDVLTFYGKDSAEFEKAQAYKAQVLQQFKTTEQLEKGADLAKQTEEINRSLQGQVSARQAAMQRELAEIDRLVQEFAGSEEQKVAFVEKAEAAKAAIRAKYAQETPMGRQMKEWSDFSGNMEKATTQWMDSFTSGISGMITGTGDLKSAVTGMINDIVNMGVKYLMSSMMGAKGGKTGKSAASLKSGGKSMPFKTAHTGGIVGATSLATSFVNPSHFATARKYHTGGVVGGRSLTPGEVPIIAKRGEGVFTPEQMRALGGAGASSSQVITIAPVINMNAQGGTPEQNDDLAKKTAKAAESSIRVIVQQEMRAQQRAPRYN